MGGGAVCLTHIEYSMVEWEARGRRGESGGGGWEVSVRVGCQGIRRHQARGVLEARGGLDALDLLGCCWVPAEDAGMTLWRGALGLIGVLGPGSVRQAQDRLDAGMTGRGWRVLALRAVPAMQSVHALLAMRAGVGKVRGKRSEK